MSCHQYRDLIISKVDETLTETERARLDDHLRTCTQCAAAFEAQLTARAHLIGLPQVRPSDALMPTLRRELRVMSDVHRPAEAKPGFLGMLTGWFSVPRATGAGVCWQPVRVAVAALAMVCILAAVVCVGISGLGSGGKSTDQSPAAVTPSGNGLALRPPGFDTVSAAEAAEAKYLRLCEEGHLSYSWSHPLNGPRPVYVSDQLTW